MALSQDASTLAKFGDRSTSDVIVRIRTQDGRDDWIYCHSHILSDKSKYFSDRLSDEWPTCQILDSRNCVDVYCQESYFDHHINVLRLLYTPSDDLVNTMCNVKNALGMLRVAVELGCPNIVSSCAAYLEAVPWEESEEEEILKTVPLMGSETESILQRLKPVDPTAVVRVFVSAIRFATSSPSPSLNAMKATAQEQIEYMLTEDDDAPLLTASDEIKSEAKQCVNQLLSRFSNLVQSLIQNVQESIYEPSKIESLQSYLKDLSWASHISITKLEIPNDFVNAWAEASENIVKLAELLERLDSSLTAMRTNIIEVTSRALEAIGAGHVILPVMKRQQMVVLWMPFVRSTWASSSIDEEDDAAMKIEGDMWQSLESSFVSIVLTLPLSEQAVILTEWLEEGKHLSYPDLTEAFEVWCYRSKVAKRRLGLLPGESENANKL